MFHPMHGTVTAFRALFAVVAVTFTRVFGMNDIVAITAKPMAVHRAPPFARAKRFRISSPARLRVCFPARSKRFFKVYCEWILIPL
jgi:hypothetical protein